MRLDLMIEGQEGVTWPQWIEIARACERHGISTLFRSDHYLNLDGQHPERGSLDALATVIALATQTSKLRLGTMVSPATFRHPSALAKLLTTADQISQGRVELGLGAGWHEREHQAYGFPFPDLKTRMEILAEQLEVVIGNWSEGPFSFNGKHYRLTDLDAQPKPVQKPHPPLLMGGLAGPVGARLAARFADEYNTTAYSTLAEIEQRRDAIGAACEARGREPMPFSVMTAVIVGVDQKDLHARAARVAARQGLELDELIGSPPPSWILGTVEQAAEQLSGLKNLGVSRVLCQHLDHEDLDYVEVLGRWLAPLLA
jgi:F420-dependent oxidoreductase-like protein